ncbi:MULTISPECIES: universal stress protein [unclassified Paenarthrobacter]|uniref:universal stress protein n=1 Tax=unclassified Paenarthrobacter TaxID=2634190 RepID=UPI00084E5C35|nr:universal stress protein [Paenarthrobacter sp. R1]NKR11166.1 universal stress protein UspA [Arthrobacter sp. M5]NKR14438.1 universal stress protein UspA [Arthrobacter sp. M6]OEH62163.1 universal stress protein UspA [Arthrobacter sp. D4]OEH63608.1 universal stress protein UspA [Arthrobacter sp. D2]WIV29255.1 universal stress protein [Paenarthrobacter sp. R1]
MDELWSALQDSTDEPAPGPLVLGVPWNCPASLAMTAARLAAALDLHLICAYVDPSSYLVEWSPASGLLAESLDPAVNEEAAYPASMVLERLESILGPAGTEWSFRVLNGSVSAALTRLAQSTGASMLVVGGQRPGLLPRLGRILEGSVAEDLGRVQSRPVVVVPARRSG